jgi:hypothetical protein
MGFEIPLGEGRGVMEMTTKTDLVCSVCGEPVKIKTSGLLGGIIPQMFIHYILGIKEVEKVTCSKECREKDETHC